MLKKIHLILFSIACMVFANAHAIRIGVSLPTQRDIGWVRYKEAFEKFAKKNNVTLLMQVADQNPAQQASQVENLLSQKIDILILAPQDAYAASSLVQEAHNSGIKVISLDRLIMNANVDMYISFDNVKVGALQGEYLAKNAPKGNYILLSGAPTDNNSKLFKQGAMKFLDPLIKSHQINVIMDQNIPDWQPSEAQRLVENALTANKNKVVAILAPNDNTAGGVIQALASQKLSGKIFVTGQDAELTAAQRIVNGTQSMTVFKDQRKLAEQALNIAQFMIDNKQISTPSTTNNGKIDVPSFLLKPIIVDKNNIEQELVASGYFKKEDIYSKRK